MLQTKHREANFEVLRVMAMLLIVVCHFYSHGIFKTAEHYSSVSSTLFAPGSLVAHINYFISEYIHLISCTAVNCYVLITGYFMAGKSFKIQRITHVWIELLFYSVIITAVLMLLGIVPVSIKQILKSYFPIAFNQYWFITNYIGLLIFSPILNVFINNVDRKFYFKSLLLLGIIAFTFVLFIPWGNTYGGSYSLLWFVYLYLVAGYIRKAETYGGSKVLNNNGKRLFITSVAVFIYGLGWQLFSAYLKHHGLLSYSFTYNGLTFFVSLFVFLWFKNHKFVDSRLINSVVSIAPFTLGVYLISDHPLLRGLLWQTVIPDGIINRGYFLLFMIAVCILIFIACILADVIRTLLFRFLGLYNLIDTEREKAVLFLRAYTNNGLDGVT